MAQIEERLSHVCREHGVTIATAESCTGGLVAHRITNVAGSSEYFLMGAVTYSNASKASLLGVPEQLIAAHGAVSSEVAVAMATGARNVSGCGVAVGTTGIAGPEGATETKPVGLIYVAVASAAGTRSRKCNFSGDRHTIKEQAAEAALEIVIQEIQTLCDPR